MLTLRICLVERGNIIHARHHIDGVYSGEVRFTKDEWPPYEAALKNGSAVLRPSHESLELIIERPSPTTQNQREA